MREFTVYYVIPHGSKYKIELTNPFNDRRCCCTILIDGYAMDRRLVIKQGETVALERHLTRAELFTFLRTKLVGEAESASAALKQNPRFHLSNDEKNAMACTPLGSGIVSNRKENGLIHVTFSPEEWKIKLTHSKALLMSYPSHMQPLVVSLNQ